MRSFAILLSFPLVCGSACAPQEAQSEPTARVRRVETVSIDGSDYLRVEARANTHRASLQSAASLGFAPDGSLTVGWQSRRQQGGNDGVFAQRFSSLGLRVGGERCLSATTRSHQRAPALASGEHRVYAWRSFAQDGDAGACYLREGEAGPELRLHATGKGDQQAPVLAAGERLVLAGWLDGRNRLQMRPFVRSYDSAARRLGDEECLDARNATTLALAARPGGFVAVWAASDDSGEPAGVYLRLLDAGAVPFAEALRVDDGKGRAGIEPAIAAAADGFVVAWHVQAEDGSGYELRARRYALDARARGPSLCVATSERGHLGGGCVAMDGDGRACLAWHAGDDEGRASRVEARLLAEDGSLGPVFDLARPSGGAQTLEVASGATRIAFGPEGQLGLAWSGDAGLGDASAANLSLLLPLPRFAAAVDRHEPVRESRAPGARSVASGEPRFTSEVAMPHDPPTYDPTTIGTPPGGTAQALVTSPDFGFAGMPNTGWNPPDPHLAVGPAHCVQVANGGIAFFSRQGKRSFFQTISGSGGFWGKLGATRFVFDPEVHWDPHSRRFFALAAERATRAGRSYFLLAVSDDADPNGTWHKYRLDVTSLGSIGSGGNDIDSPNLAVDAKVLYLTADFFRGGQHYLIYMLDKTPLLAGKAPTTTRSLMIRGTQSHGIPVVWGTAPAMYLIEHFEATTNRTVRLHAITNPLTTPKIVSHMLTVPAYGRPSSATQRGTTARIATFDARFWSTSWRNGSLWAAQHHGSPLKARWYEIKTGTWPASGTPTLVQSGDVVPPSSGAHAFFNSISVDAAGNALMTFATSSSSEFVSIARAYRLAGDAKGTMRPAVRIQTNVGGWTRSRWGDYSAVAVDPVKPKTLWYTHEYAPTFNIWGTWIGHKTFEPFASDVSSISAKTGGTIRFILDNPSQKGKPYLILGTISGTTPGLKLGALTLPINWDAFTGIGLSALNTPLFAGFLGVLDAQGVANASITAPSIPSSFAGSTAHFAYVQDLVAWTFASNAVGIKILP